MALTKMGSAVGRKVKEEKDGREEEERARKSKRHNKMKAGNGIGIGITRVSCD